MNIRTLFGVAACSLLLSFAPEKENVTIYMIGDSTMSNKEYQKGTPERGWGMVLQPFFDEAVTVENHARNGRSTKSFVDEGLWDVVEQRMDKGDYLFIQFAHNDEKEGDRYSSPEDYAKNLTRFIDIARSKGVTPVLFTPIIRRHFDGDTIVDTHGRYPEMCKKVAAEQHVVLVDLEELTRNFFEPMGEVASRDYFMCFPEWKYAVAPEGKEDNTHLVARGARAVARMACEQLVTSIPELAPHIRFYDFVVAKDGSGDFMTVQDAVDALPDFCKQTLSLYICNGTYQEKVVIPSTKQNLRFIGQSVENVIITYGNFATSKGYNGMELGTSGSATVYIAANDFVAENITFANTAGNVGQAVAVLTQGTRQYFVNCHFLGNQDTVYLYGVGNRDGLDDYVPNYINYFKDCYIEGTTDFIFGSAMALFQNCEIHTKKNSYITAASSLNGQPIGYLFLDCHFTAADEVTKSFLGRPWRLYAQTVLLNCHLDDHITPLGWHDWGKPEAHKTTYYGEYQSTGAGANVKDREKWSHILKAKEAEKLIKEWFPITVPE